jgi:hypothetical protein
VTGGAEEPRARPGIVLPLALIALVALGLIASSLAFVAGQQRVIASRRADLVRARLAAETALALALTRWEPGTELPAGEPHLLGWSLGTLPGAGRHAASAEVLDEGFLFLRGTGQTDAGAFASAGLLARLPDLDAIADGVTAAIETAGPLFVGDFGVVGGAPATLAFEPDPPCPGSGPQPLGGALRLPESAELWIADGAIIDGEVIRAPPGQTREDVAEWLQLADHRLAGNVVVAPATEGDACVASPTNWGAPYSPDSPCARHAPFLHATGALELVTGAGQGVLYAAEELRLRRGTAFFGLIVAVGALEVEPDALVRGAIVAGGPVRIDGEVSFNRCLVAWALSSSGLNRPARRLGRTAVPAF